MVNAAKRMRALTDLYHARNGAGAVILPAAPQPQIRSIYMRLPTGQYEGLEWYMGARDFWRTELKRLKFWNPTLPTTVETIRAGSNEPMYLSVEYESPNQETLSQLKVQPYPKPQLHIKQPKTPNPLGGPQADPRRSQQPLRDPRRPIPSPKTLQPVSMTEEILAHAPQDEIKQVSRPPQGSPQQGGITSQTFYTRTVTLPLAGLRHIEIWNWIRQHTRLPDHKPIPSEDGQPYQEVARFKKQAAKDRKRVKAGIDAMKKEQLELRKAREAAERMAADSV